MTVCVIMKFWNESQLLPLTLEQFRDSGIDCLNLFDDGSTDDSFSVATEIISGFPFKTSLIRISEPHDRYFPDDATPESVTLNRMIDSAAAYDWCIHIDADELFSSGFSAFVKYLQSDANHPTAYYISFYHLVDEINKHIITMPGLPYQLFPDYKNKIFKPHLWRHPEHMSLDSPLIPVYPGNDSRRAIDAVSILHLHYLWKDRRGLRNGNADLEDGDKQHSFRAPGTVYGTVPDEKIPESLIEFVSNTPIWW